MPRTIPEGMACAASSSGVRVGMCAELIDAGARYAGGGARGDGPKMDFWRVREREKKIPVS